MLLVVGLGNPGSEYADNRHNIGFMAVDAIQRAHGFSAFRKSKFHGELADGTIGGQKILLLKPTTYMNESGRAVQAAMTFYKVAPEDVLVFHDELDLVGGKVRVKRGGGHAGHNGLRSIHAHVGNAYARVRLGIGHPGDKDRVIGHVLKDFSKAEMVWVDKLVDAVGENFSRLAKGDEGGFMSKVAAAVAPPKEDKNKEEDT
ncbi:MAG: aminoacyl-tRNA hydrolase [Rhodospirillaceae bacterium]|nr:aminoacyl-tRNA hydrolase [Rhodospirillaceae bacterium]